MTEDQQQPTSSTRKSPVFIDEDKNTILHYVAANGKLNKVKTEIEEENHEIDPMNYLGWTPLMMATRYGHKAVVSYLLDKRADSTRKNKFGFNVLLMAVASGKLDVLHLILQHLLRGGVSRQTIESFFSPISLAVLFNNVNIMQYLIEKRFCINVECSTGLRPITFANALRNSDIINILMTNGASNQQAMHDKEVMNANNYLPPKPIPPPLIIVNPNHFTSQPAVFQVTPSVSMPRKCSGMISPCFSPNFSPLPPGYVQQVFFPPNFSPTPFISSPINPQLSLFPNNEFLNVGFMQVSPHYSPVPINMPYNIPYTT